ncbi:hypothetical protein BMS3Abin01_01014 [bacterium BMS3Abin01]|nr:hypothetical protein BMS3Abin01_01014 [bacterium BMS3Abin01]HDY69330.1 hypothetical protein [Actinomycetota bacterium]
MASLTINLDSIEHNTRLVRNMIEPHGTRLVGVTKACLGDEAVAAAMLSAGAAALADSRPESIRKLRRRFPDTELQLLRPPGDGSGAGDIPADLFFVSNAGQARSSLSSGAGHQRRFLLMVETGDGREGVPADLAPAEAGKLAALEGAIPAGFATNAACSRPAAATAPALALLMRTADMARRQLGPVDGDPSFIISAGGSGLLRPAVGTANDASPAGLDRLDDLRCGEALLLGRIPHGDHHDLFLPGGRRDAFLLDGSVLEVYRKNGDLRALVDIGAQDTGSAPVIPCGDGVRVTSVTSDYLVASLESDSCRRRVRAGGSLSFIPTYYALLAAMTSPFIDKRYTGI